MFLRVCNMQGWTNKHFSFQLYLNGCELECRLTSSVVQCRLDITCSMGMKNIHFHPMWQIHRIWLWFSRLCFICLIIEMPRTSDFWNLIRFMEKSMYTRQREFFENASITNPKRFYQWLFLYHNLLTRFITCFIKRSFSTELEKHPVNITNIFWSLLKVNRGMERQKGILSLHH